MDFLEKSEVVSIYIELHRGQIVETSYDKIKLKEIFNENRKRFFYSKGETPETKKLVKQMEVEATKEIELKYDQEVKKFKEQIEKNMSRLGEQGKKFLFKIEDFNNPQ